CATFTPQGQVAVGTAYTLRLFDVSGRQPKLIRRFFGHTAPVEAIAVSPDKSYLASGAADQTVRIWSLTDPGKNMNVGSSRGLENVVQPLLSVFTGSDGEWVAWN